MERLSQLEEGTNENVVLVCIEHIQTVSLLDFKNFITIVCVRNVWPHCTVHIWGSEDNFLELVLSTFLC